MGKEQRQWYRLTSGDNEVDEWHKGPFLQASARGGGGSVEADTRYDKGAGGGSRACCRKARYRWDATTSWHGCGTQTPALELLSGHGWLRATPWCPRGRGRLSRRGLSEPMPCGGGHAVSMVRQVATVQESNACAMGWLKPRQHTRGR
jgi:hypothetical protein